MRKKTPHALNVAERFILSLIVALTWAGPCAIAKPCPPLGDSKNKRIQAIDFLKNRTGAPDRVSPLITLETMLAPGDEYEPTRFLSEEAATITGYVALVKPGGPETCHCHQTGAANEDTHIALVSDPKFAKPKMMTRVTVDAKGKKHSISYDFNARYHVIVEVTPQSRKAFGIADTATLRKQLVGHWATFTGYMFFDEEHKQNALNTNPDGTDIWRATCWELHPVTAIKIVDKLTWLRPPIPPKTYPPDTL